MRQDSDSDKIAENDCSYLVLCAFFDQQIGCKAIPNQITVKVPDFRKLETNFSRCYNTPRIPRF